jgi:four helix bundle protein
MTVKTFEELDIWKEARALSKNVFELTENMDFSKDMRFISQIRSSSGSIMDNIAEGFDRGGNKEFVQFLSIAKGSCSETRSQLYRAIDFAYISTEYGEELISKTIELGNKIGALIQYLKTSTYKGSKFTN